MLQAGVPKLFCACQALPESPAAGPAGPDISLLKPQLRKQWHHAKNYHLGNVVIHPSSNLHVWWTCDQCPCGLPHEWLATICGRQGMNNQCPFCANKSVCHHNSLLTMAPSVAFYWDTAKNGVTADQVLAGCSTRGHWLCPTCTHSWQAVVGQKVVNKSGCPKCSLRSEGYTRQPTLTARHVDWICTNYPRGRPPLYSPTPANRMTYRSGCPYCSSKQACICKSLPFMCLLHILVIKIALHVVL